MGKLCHAGTSRLPSDLFRGSSEISGTQSCKFAGEFVTLGTGSRAAHSAGMTECAWSCRNFASSEISGTQNHSCKRSSVHASMLDARSCIFRLRSCEWTKRHSLCRSDQRPRSSCPGAPRRARSRFYAKARREAARVLGTAPRHQRSDPTREAHQALASQVEAGIDRGQQSAVARLVVGADGEVFVALVPDISLLAKYRG